ncbi:InlB B-repeat-containing protein [Lysinibacillus sp. NPDC094177]|uniref:InlB B-repeat-containing protein n=1 Tax=Lysinibacillus sp. NPDC094177 TaxID=3390580 RepID=UPI003CFEC58B
MNRKRRKIVTISLILAIILSWFPSTNIIYATNSLPNGIQTFSGYTFFNKVGTSPDGFFQITSNRETLQADKDGAYIYNINDNKNEVETYFEIKVGPKVGSFSLKDLNIGEFADNSVKGGYFKDITIKGYVEGKEVFSTIPYTENNPDMIVEKFPIDYTPANGKSIDSFRIYFTKAAGSSFGGFNLVNFTIGDASTSIPVVPTYQVKFDADGGSTVADQTIKHGEKATKPVDPTKEGNTFAGWYTDSEYKTAFDFNTNIIEDTTLHAKWLPAEAGVTVAIGNAKASKGQTVEVPVSINKPSTGIGAYGMRIDFDPSVFEVMEVVSTYPGFVSNILNDSGYLKVIWLDETGGDNPISSAADLFKVKLKVKSDAPLGDSSLTIDKTDKEKLNFCDVDANDILADAVNGKVTIVNSYNVNFDVKGGSSVDSQTVIENGKAIKPATPSKEGYTFDDWYMTNTFQVIFDFNNTKITKDTTIYAKWSPIQYTVSFDSGGGSTVAGQTFNHGEKATKPADPTKAGSTFAGWYTTNTFETPFDFENTAITKETTVYAKWTPVQYTVSFNSGGGSAVADQTINHGEKVSKPAEPSKAGYALDGWYVDNTLFDFANTTITQNTTILAKWIANKCKINFDSNGGTNVPDVTTNYNTTIEAPTAPTKEGYTFEGWYKESELTNAWNFTTDKVKDITTLYAKWNPKQYTVSFEVYGGSAVTSQTINHGEKVSKPVAPTKEDHTFFNWYLENTFNTLYDYENTTIIKNTTIFAKWTPNEYKVSFDSKGGSSVAEQNVKYNETAKLPTPPTKEGYTFVGWYADPSDNTAYDFERIIKSNVTLYAKWVEKEYNVTFDVNDGSTINSEKVKYGNKVTKPTNPTKAGYKFAGWYTDREFQNLFDFNSNINADTTLYAKWIPNKYKVSFNVDGGSDVESQTINHGEKVAKPVAPTKEGYTLDGWYVNNTLFNFADTAITQDTTILAKWKPNKNKISFDSNGGADVPDVITNYDTIIEAPNAPTKEGYTFGGWYKESGLTNAWNFTTDKVKASTTLYAKWTSKQYTLSFDVDGGSAINSEKVKHGNKVTKPTNPTKSGYTFAGWYTDNKFETPFDFEKGITSDSTIYAKWTKNIDPTPGPGPAPDPTPGPTTEQIVIDVVDDTNPNELLVRTPITRTKETDGTVKDSVIFNAEKAAESVSKLENQETKIARIIIPDEKDQVSETKIEVPKQAINALKQGETNLSISTVNGTIFIPTSSLTTFTDDLYFRIVPVKKKEEQSAIETRAKQEEKVKEVVKDKTATIEVLGRPMTIETNMQSRPVTLTFPLPSNLTQDQKDNLAIFIEHSDGTKEVVRGKIVEFKKGQLGIQFNVDKFSTFTTLYMEGANEYFGNQEAKHTAYIHGFTDGTFRPNADVTRAQMAAMLARNLSTGTVPEASMSYNDTNTSWAKNDIEFARQAGIMLGYNDIQFGPNDSITRAQMAVITARWIEKQCANDQTKSFCQPNQQHTAYKDVINKHWAAKEIERISGTKIMVGFKDGTFKPDAKLTRAQAVKVLNRLFQRGPLEDTATSTFKDVQTSHWAFKEIEEAAATHAFEMRNGIEYKKN